MDLAIKILLYFMGLPLGIFFWKLALTPKINIYHHEKIPKQKECER